MKIIAPDYYKKFSCIAGNCKHSCCIGWEIDIDNDTYEYYKSFKYISKHISDSETPHFILGENERCPFLNSDNLCEIIINHGEDKLCDICTDHPRFRNFYDSRTEIGIGLCCEAAAELIISNPDITTLEIIGCDDEEECEYEDETIFFEIRNQIFRIAADRTKSLDKRIKKIISDYNIRIPEIDIKQWSDFYLSLERLDSKWTDELNFLKNSDNIQKSSLPDEPFEQLLVYFIYRHLPESIYDLRFSERLAFAIISVRIIYSLCTAHNGDIKNLADLARMYSAEIEYSEDNTNRLLDFISKGDV